MVVNTYMYSALVLVRNTSVIIIIRVKYFYVIIVIGPRVKEIEPETCCWSEWSVHDTPPGLITPI